ncbi:hypothetical protein RINTHH_22460 [Richelia intracellularis HH01]|uniref:Uncharacterized protein n=1 Tax=Richelia intracellularis HH01 TaxID=1165094 RepID=M1X6S2_9NOST|nr:hypothetical protein RINTHH_22460 [Richelia intracellularis HH01]
MYAQQNDREYLLEGSKQKCLCNLPRHTRGCTINNINLMSMLYLGQN